MFIILIVLPEYYIQAAKGMERAQKNCTPPIRFVAWVVTLTKRKRLSMQVHRDVFLSDWETLALFLGLSRKSQLGTIL